MKKFILGFICAFVLSFSTVAFASGKIEVDLFSAKFIVNGISKEPESDYVVMNYKGHVYVPIRFVAESAGTDIHYDSSSRTVHIDTKEASPSQNAEPTVDSYNFRIKTNIKPGMSQQDLYSYIKEPSLKDEVNKIWRYDLISADSYAYSGHTADLKALQEGGVDFQLFVHWNEKNEIAHYEVWYVKQTPAGREIYHYTVDGAGITEEKVEE